MTTAGVLGLFAAGFCAGALALLLFVGFEIEIFRGTRR